MKNFIYSDFLYLDMGFDIYDFVFFEILKYDYSSSALTGELQHDIIFGLMIPTIFIALVAYTGVNKIFGEAHKVIGYLASITAVGVIMTLGWVPIIAGIGGPVFVVLIALYFMVAFYRRIVSHGHEKKLVDAAGWAGGKMDLGRVVLSGRDERKLGKQLRNFDEEYNTAQRLIDNILGGKDKEVTKVVVDKLDVPKQTEISRQSQIKSNAIEEGENIVEQVPRGRRDEIIKRYTQDKFQKEMRKLFNKLKEVENE